MRVPIAIALALALVVVVLGAMQALSSIALRDDARSWAWPHAVPPSVAARVDRLDPARALPETLRLVLAREALARGDDVDAEAHVARLSPSRDRLALVGELADARGDATAAVRAYLDAGDLSGVERHVATLVAGGRVADALALQRAVVTRLSDERGQADTLAEAYFQLGRIEETQAYALAVGADARHRHEMLAGGAYGRAVALAPLEERYLIAFGNQQLNLDDIAGAERAFERAHDVDPTSAEPLAGLGDAAFSRDDATAARTYLARARALDPASDAVRNLARELGD